MTRDLLARTTLHCQTGGRSRTVLDCISCPRFVNYALDRALEHVVVRCEWSPDDLVGELMTLAPWHQVRPSCSVPDANKLAWLAGVEHLLVVDRGQLMGLVCRGALAMADSTTEVGIHAYRNFVAVSPETRLIEAAYVMKHHGISCLPVVDAGVLRGLISRSDLRRAGFSLRALGPGRCEICQKNLAAHSIQGRLTPQGRLPLSVAVIRTDAVVEPRAEGTRPVDPGRG